MTISSDSEHTTTQEKGSCTVGFSEALGMFVAVGRGCIGLGDSEEAARARLHLVDPRALHGDIVGKMVAQLLVREERGQAVTVNHDRIDDLRSKISGWHFARESLTKREYEMSYAAEQLLHSLDELCGGYVR